MNFAESVKTCFKKYANFNGRASRSEFWFFVLFYYAVIILSVVFMTQTESYGFLVFIFGFALVSLFPYLAVTVRRLHDINQPGTWVLAAVIASFISRVPGLGLVSIISAGLNILILVNCAREGDKKNNRFGKSIYKKRKRR